MDSQIGKIIVIPKFSKSVIEWQKILKRRKALTPKL